MTGEIHIESEKPTIAGLPASFRVVFKSDQAIEVGGRLRLIYDYRGSDRKESAGQTTNPGAANYISCVSATGISPHLRTYSVAHSYKPSWSEEPECFMWLDMLGPQVSLNSHVVEAGFVKGGLPAGGVLTFHFGGNERGYRLSRKSYEAYPVWAIVDATGDGRWQAVGKAVMQINPAAPARLVCILPSTAYVGEETPLRIQAFDGEFNAIDDAALPQLISTPGLDLDLVKRTVRFTAAGEGHLGKGDGSPLTIGSNPSLVMEAPPENRIFWGDIHGHCNVCDGGLRSPEEYFTWGRDAMALDFCALTPHDFGIALSEPETQWNRLQATANEFNAPGSFVTLIGWEASHIGLPSGQPVGHKNIIFRGDQAPFVNGSNYGTPRVHVNYHSYPGLIEYLQHLDCLVIPHHTLNPVLPGGLGTNWNEFWPARERLVEIYSLWGASEGMDTPGRTAEAVEGASVLAALMRGYRMGFIAGSDTHDGRPANPHEPWSTANTAGLTAVFAPGLTRETVYDALWQRSCYGTTGARIILRTDIAGLPTGRTRSLTLADEAIYERDIRLHVIGTDDIEQAEVIRNGQIIHAFTGDGMAME
nr:DUF3604 domain-containing protein [Chloroflexota bacterium]